MERVMTWLVENYQPPIEALTPKKYKHWRDAIFPYKDPDNYIDYLIDIGKHFSIAVVSCQASSSLLVHFRTVVAHLSRGSRFSSRSARWPPHDGVRRRGRA